MTAPPRSALFPLRALRQRIASDDFVSRLHTTAATNLLSEVAARLAADAERVALGNSTARTDPNTAYLLVLDEPSRAIARTMLCAAPRPPAQQQLYEAAIAAVAELGTIEELRNENITTDGHDLPGRRFFRVTPPSPQPSEAAPLEIGSRWQHKNGNYYTVDKITNRDSTRQEDYPVTVV